MIEKSDKVFHLTCDVCGEKALEVFFEFNEAVNYKKMNGWKSQKYKGEWEDVCPECQEEKS
jgi:Fe2+ or Zn2+ uptake regulation protein